MKKINVVFHLYNLYRISGSNYLDSILIVPNLSCSSPVRHYLLNDSNAVLSRITPF